MSNRGRRRRDKRRKREAIVLHTACIDLEISSVICRVHMSSSGLLYFASYSDFDKFMFPLVKES